MRSDYCCVIEARRDLAKKNWSPPSEEENQGGKDNQNILPPPFVQYLTSHCPALLKEFSFQRSRGVWNRQFSLDSKLFRYLAKYEYYSLKSKIQQMTTDHNQRWIQPEGSFHKLGHKQGLGWDPQAMIQFRRVHFRCLDTTGTLMLQN